MSQETKKYHIVEFIYTDNEQIFQTGADMDEDEVRNMEKVLGRYEDAGAIEQACVYELKKVEGRTYDMAVDEIMEALKTEVHDDSHSQCQNCDRIWPDDVLINPIPDIFERVAPGEIMPSGECPACGAVCHIIDEEEEAEGAKA